MSRIGDLAGTTSGVGSGGQTRSNGFDDISSGQFMALLLSELQNQDPLNPMENSDMVAQISQIRNIGATDQLTQTLSSLRESQELVTASSLIGQTIKGLADDALPVDGQVDRVTVEIDSDNKSRKVKVHVGNQTMDIKNIRTILTG
jgi:flagellar basal-body rod modification protein FlgD